MTNTDLVNLAESPASMAAKAEAAARKQLAEMLASGMSTVSIARKLGINRGLIPYVLDGGHSPTVLEALGLPVYERREIPVCMDCGHVHTMHKLCEKKRRQQVRFRKSADLETKEDQEALEKIAVTNGFENWTDMCRYMAKLYNEFYPVTLHIRFEPYASDIALAAAPWKKLWGDSKVKLTPR